MSSSDVGGVPGQQLSISSLLKKTEHYDKDERYMATSDLCEVLKRQGDHHHGGGGGGGDGTGTQQQQQQPPTGGGGGMMDASTERQICTAVLRLLHDKSNDVQAIAVKTLSVLLTTVKQEQVLEIADSLADQVLDASKSELRDVYAIGLRTLVKTVPSAMGNRVSQRLVGRLLDGIRTSEDEEIVLACLDVLTDLLQRFGATALSVTRQHEPILQMCLNCLSSPAAVVRKRAGNTVGCLSAVLSDALLMRMVEALLSQIDLAAGVGREGRRKTAAARGGGGGAGGNAKPAAAAAGDTRALIRTMCTVSGAVGHRLGQAQIDRILPIFLRFTDPEDAVNGDDDDDDVDMGGGGDGGGGGADGDGGGVMDGASSDDMGAGTGGGLTEDEAAVALANELRESCFMGFESFVLRCPAEVEPHLESIVQAALAYMSYDPNYSYGTADDEDLDDQQQQQDDEDDDDEYEDDDDDDDEYEEEDDLDEDDDDDESWKVRRSAIRALKAVVEAKKHADPSQLWTVQYRVRRGRRSCVASALVNRFKEREENCRVGVMDCFTRLLAVTVAAARQGTARFAAAGGGGANAGAGGDAMEVTPPPGDGAAAADSAAPAIDLRNEYAPKLVRACEKILSVKKGNERSKSAALSLLATLCKAPGGVGGRAEIESVFRHVRTFLQSATQQDLALHRESTSKALRLDALSLVHAILDSDRHDPDHVRVSLRQTLLPELCQAVKEQWYKVIAEALRALAAVPRFFATGDDDDDEETVQVAGMLYGSIEPLLAAHDVDQEIKECALKATAALLSNLHGSLTKEQSDRLLSLLLDRLKNETTRIVAIKTLSAIAARDGEGDDEKKKLDLAPILADSVSTMAQFLKLQSRSLKQSSLEALDRVVTYHGSKESAALYGSVLRELAPLVQDSDLHLAHLSLRATVSILRVCPAAGPAVKDYMLEPALRLSTSSMLSQESAALESLLQLFKQVVVSNAVDYDELLSMLRQRLNGDGEADAPVRAAASSSSAGRTASGSGSGAAGSGGKHNRARVYNLAKCIAVITAHTSQEKAEKVLAEMLQLLEAKPPAGGPGEEVPLALLLTGDLGRMVDLSERFKANNAAERLKKIYLSFFDCPWEDLKHAAAYALGNASVGSQATFLPAIVTKLDEDKKKQQYLLLTALREFIQCLAAQQQKFRAAGITTSAGSSNSGIASSLPVILPPLEKHCQDEEEGVRTMVAECMGSLACLEPVQVLPKLDGLHRQHAEIVEDDVQKKKNAMVCWTVATSIKLAIANKVDPTQLALHMPSFLTLLSQQDVAVRNAALLMVYSAVHHMPQTVQPLFKESVLPALYAVSELKLERRVDLGPFTHSVDDALPLRKAALSIFATSLDNLPLHSLDVAAFMPVLAKALGDQEDIQLHAHQIIISMCRPSGSSSSGAPSSSSPPPSSSLSPSQQPQSSGATLAANHSAYSAYLVQAADSFVEPLEKTIHKKQGQRTGTELERLNDWIKSALRATMALAAKLEQSQQQSRKFSDFVDRTTGNHKFSAMLDAVAKEEQR